MWERERAQRPVAAVVQRLQSLEATAERRTNADIAVVGATVELRLDPEDAGAGGYSRRKTAS
jgi:hypothetical protein